LKVGGRAALFGGTGVFIDMAPQLGCSGKTCYMILNARHRKRG